MPSSIPSPLASISARSRLLRFVNACTVAAFTFSAFGLKTILSGTASPATSSTKIFEVL